jgi:hypothetical protein
MLEHRWMVKHWRVGKMVSGDSEGMYRRLLHRAKYKRNSDSHSLHSNSIV